MRLIASDNSTIPHVIAKKLELQRIYNSNWIPLIHYQLQITPKKHKIDLTPLTAPLSYPHPPNSTPLPMGEGENRGVGGEVLRFYL